jgi:flagellar export protein FliJ
MANRNCWVVLERKAHDQVRDLHQQLQTLQTKTEQLQGTLDRLMGMYAEYQAKENHGGTHVGLQSSMNQRQFMAQLLSLRERIERDLTHQHGLMAQVRAQLIKAEAERMKMQSLVDQEDRAERNLRSLTEQKRMDELAVSRFNVGHSF